MTEEIKISDISRAIEKCKKGFWQFEKKHRVYWCDVTDGESGCENPNSKGSYFYKGDNKLHFLQGNPEVLLMSEKNLKLAKRIFEDETKRV